MAVINFKRTNVVLSGFESRYVEYITPFCYLNFSSFFPELSLSSAQIKQINNFRSLEDTKKCLDREFEGNYWIVKRATETYQADIIWYQCTKCGINVQNVVSIIFVFFLHKINTDVAIYLNKNNHVKKNGAQMIKFIRK
ncbi:hypothetical protein BpHYR1_049873 [Brachionus plicatilis]|uniref:Uncharacterized protein n=1 Tax=Brachionus plicatilis TaxID=10195 RepID=A0A3M7PU34_BRAPC|nr:hypothetical protein BpHYR1_049873 [Brachionus plicatilis]